MIRSFEFFGVSVLNILFKLEFPVKRQLQITFAAFLKTDLVFLQKVSHNRRNHGFTVIVLYIFKCICIWFHRSLIVTRFSFAFSLVVSNFNLIFFSSFLVWFVSFVSAWHDASMNVSEILGSPKHREIQLAKWELCEEIFADKNYIFLECFLCMNT